MVLKSPPYFSFSALQRIRRPREIADTTPQSFIIFTQYTLSIKINGRKGVESNYRGPPLCVKNCRSNSFSSRRLEPKRCCTTYEPNWFQALHKKSPYYYYHDVIKTSERCRQPHGNRRNQEIRRRRRRHCSFSTPKNRLSSTSTTKKFNSPVRLKGTGTKALAIAATRATSRMVRRAMVPVFIWFDGKQRRVPKSERR